jgi:putative membrane protein
MGNDIQKIDPEYVKVCRVWTALVFLFIFIIFSLLFFFFSFISGSGAMFYIALGILGTILLPLSLLYAFPISQKYTESFSVQLDEDGISINSGILNKSRKFIPYNKIQGLQLTSGLIERHWGLSSMRIETAAGILPKAIMPILGLRNPDKLIEEIHMRMRNQS